MAKDIRTVLNAFQLVSGLICHVFESLDIPITYLPTGWLPRIHNRLCVRGGSILIKDACKPHSQQLEDDSITEVIVANTVLTPNEKLLANECRMWLRVITISDIADMDGQSIIDSVTTIARLMASHRRTRPRVATASPTK